MHINFANEIMYLDDLYIKKVGLLSYHSLLYMHNPHLSPICCYRLNIIFWMWKRKRLHGASC